MHVCGYTQSIHVHLNTALADARGQKDFYACRGACTGLSGTNLFFFLLWIFLSASACKMLRIHISKLLLLCARGNITQNIF